MKDLKQQLREYVAAVFSGIWIQTAEPEEAQAEIAQLAKDESWNLKTWDVARGMWCTPAGENDPTYPLADLLRTPPQDGQAGVLVLWHYHRFLNAPAIMQTTVNTLLKAKQQNLFVFVLSPVVQIPIELENLFVVVNHELPDADTLKLVGHELQPELPPPTPAVTNAALGLTRGQAESAFALSLARHNEYQAETVFELKANALKKSGLLELHRGKETFADLGGLDALKQFCRQALAVKENVSLKPKGIMLLGVPGTGKSAFAKALGNEVQRPTLTLDVGALYGSLVGQTEERIRKALAIADAMAPCILFIDEIEKALSGVGSSGDSGVASRLFGTLLTWLSDHESDVFVIATSNDVSKLPPEFSRAERWDAIYFLDIPTAVQRCKIWQLYQTFYQLGANEKPASNLTNDDQWTGAEIKACCRLAALLSVSLTKAGSHVIPISNTAPEKVSALREWASGRCLDASEGGIYYATKQQPTNTGRRSLTTRSK